ncbi:hypothetical protein ACHAW5_006239 [Stephanodiscus triporus]|uniref:Sulfotransferase domain-containing protein n=1 Tax=Stephanodiscus triporus TaxID=2934178 RepID=A0ABD3PKP3_9STRA
MTRPRGLSSNQRKKRLRRSSIHVWIWPLGLGCLYSSMLLRHYNLASREGSIGDDRRKNTSVAPLSSSSRSRQLDGILSKYNLTTAILDRSYPKIKIPDVERSMAFLHIGKTGGSTISLHLRRGCRRTNPLPCKDRNDGWILNETATSKRIEGYYHLEDIPPDSLRRFTTIVTAVRNPMTRFTSAFAYHHPSNAIATDNIVEIESIHKFSCFPTIGYLVKAGMGRAEIPWNMAHLRKGRPVRGSRVFVRNPSKVSNDVQYNCTELAFAAFGLNDSWTKADGDVADDIHHPWLTHMSFNYRRYYRSMPSDKELIVLRNNHLWEDWAEVNRLLGGGDADTTHPFQENERNVSGNYRMKERWTIQTPEEQLWLCRLLHEEIRYYIMIVSRAINLDEDDLWEALNDVDGMCSETRVRIA